MMRCPCNIIGERYVGYRNVWPAASSQAKSESGGPLVKSAAEKALAIDPADSEAHSALASIAAMFDYDWKAAEQHFRKAMAAEPVPPMVRFRYALYRLHPAAVRGSVVRVDGQSLLEELPCFRCALRREAQEVILSFQVILIGFDIHRLRAGSQPKFEPFRDRLADFILNGEHVGHVAIVAF
jgi:hypothetical protein